MSKNQKNQSDPGADASGTEGKTGDTTVANQEAAAKTGAPGADASGAEGKTDDAAIVDKKGTSSKGENKSASAAQDKTSDAADKKGAGKSVVVSALEKIGREALSRNGSLSAVYVTADGTAFSSENSAINHAKSLNIKGIVTVKSMGNEQSEI